MKMLFSNLVKLSALSCCATYFSYTVFSNIEKREAQRIIDLKTEINSAQKDRFEYLKKIHSTLIEVKSLDYNRIFKCYNDNSSNSNLDDVNLIGNDDSSQQD
uniref:Uncharacterized protein n=1 Tax=Cacopsylla melanoneura TaxID=428564 RepID=A0A8D8SKI9_9HEMI